MSARANAKPDCDRAGQLGHRWCGICPAHGVPRSECGHPASTSMGCPVTLMADGMEQDDAHAENGPDNDAAWGLTSESAGDQS